MLGERAMADTIIWSKSKQVNTNLVVKLNGGSTEGSNMFTYNGSAAKTINITASSIGAAASSHNHSASNITSGTLPITRGGTGATTALAAQYNLLNTALSQDAGWSDTTNFAYFTANPTTANGAIMKYKASNVWDDWLEEKVKDEFAEDLTNVYDDSSLSLDSLTLDGANDPIFKYYICRSDGGGITITGRPDDANKKAFILRVERMRYISTTDYVVRQTYVDTNSSVIWYRHGVMNKTMSWREWAKIYSEYAKPTPSEIGAAAASHGTHVSFSSTVPLAAGTASAGSATTVARSDHRHPLQTTVSGNAGSATKLATARTINGVSFNGTANINVPNNYFVVLSDENLNDYKTSALCGEYYAAGGNNVTNTPSAASGHFYLRVFRSANSHFGQLLYSEGIWYSRFYNASTWSSWAELYGSNNKPTASEIGAAASSHNHSASNITSGTLPVSRGGTGITSNPSMLINLASTSTASVFAASPRPGVTGTLPIARGGTGATTALAANYNIFNSALTQDGGWSDNTTLAYFTGAPSTTQGAIKKYKAGEVWADWMKSKVENTYVIAGKKEGTEIGILATAEGANVEASGNMSHAEGSNTVASGLSSHAEGVSAEASGNYSHAEGSSTKASGDSSHAEGINTVASGNHSHAEGFNTTASGIASHAEGYKTTASGEYSHASGYKTTASGDYSHASGGGTEAAGALQFICGRYNKRVSSPSPALSSDSGNIFIIGNGTSNSKANAFRVATRGATYGSGSYNSSGADYAEYFEWKDKNTNNEDRVGLFVTLDEQYIRIANSKDDYILGIISGNPSVIGDSYFGDNWHGMYKTDVFGRLLTEIVHIDEYIDEDTKETVPEHDEERLILNPDWNSELEYDAREDRPEWDAVGLVGKLVVIDDGTCEVNNYCKVADNGIATKSDNTSGYRVMKRLDDTHIQILFR